MPAPTVEGQSQRLDRGPQGHQRTTCCQYAFTAHGELQRWPPFGKWLLRELRDHDSDFADRWLAAHGDAGAVGALIREVLGRHGGPLFDGYHVVGEHPGRCAGQIRQEFRRDDRRC